MISRRALCLSLAATGTLIAVPAAAESWRTYRNARFGTKIEYPDRFTSGRPPDNGDGLGFSSRDGAKFSVSGSHNVLKHDLKALEEYLDENRESGEQVTYRAHGTNWIVRSGKKNNMIFYERYLLSHGGTVINRFEIVYPAHLESAYDAVVTRMSRSLGASRGANTEGNP
jgi:hypothetical protein